MFIPYSGKDVKWQKKSVVIFTILAKNRKVVFDDMYEKLVTIYVLDYN